ncbi:UNVERIFIED_CONTAM: Signal recognition particle protein [Sesamum indicum]
MNIRKGDVGVGLACEVEVALMMDAGHECTVIGIRVRLQPDPFLNELTNMFERTTEKGSVWVTLKHSSDKSKVQRNKMKTAGEKIEYRCLIRATDGRKTISTVVGAKDHQRFQSSYATILKARMTALKKRERKDKRKAADSDKKLDSKKRSSAAKKTSN